MVNPFLAAFAGGLLLFNSVASPRKAEKKFEGALQQAFPTAKIDVTIKGKRGFDVVNGKFRSVRVEMRDFQVGPPPAPSISAPTDPPAATSIEELPNKELLPAPGSPVPNPAAGNSPAAAKPIPRVIPPTTPPMLAIMTTAKAKDKGRVGHTEIALQDFGLGPLRVTSLDASFEDVIYDWKELKKGRALAIESAGPARASLVLPAASLDTLLRARLTSFQNPRLSLKDGLLRITGTRAAPIVGTQLPVVFTARPAVRGNEIRLEDTTLSIGGAPVPGLVARSLVNDINPVFSFDRAGTWPYRVNLTSATAQNDALSLEATLSFVPATTAAVQKK